LFAASRRGSTPKFPQKIFKFWTENLRAILTGPVMPVPAQKESKALAMEKVKSAKDPAPAAVAVGGALRTMALLEFIAGTQRPVSATEIARGTGMNPSTAFNLARTLMDEGYLQLAAGTRQYLAGPSLHALTRKVAEQQGDKELARLPMQALANRFEVVVSLWRRVSRYSMMMILTAENDAATRIQVATGVKMPLLHGSLGRIMAIEGGLADAERRQVFEVVNFERPLSYRTFMAQARLAKERGWSIDDGHVRTAVTSVSVPVATGAEALEYVCTATMFRHQHEADALEQLATELRLAAKKIAPACGGLDAAR
jgi:DNA-binding IclR family transcriptional regulator